MEGILNPESVTRQDLVDYMVNKKVREIQAKMEPMKLHSEKIYTEIGLIEKNISKEVSNFSIKHIKSTYGKMIEMMAKNLQAKEIIVPAYPDKIIGELLSSHTWHMILRMFEIEPREAFVLFMTKGEDGSPGRPGFFSASPYGTVSFIRSFIRVNMDEVANPKIQKLREKKSLMEQEHEELRKEITTMERDIARVRSDKALIKDNIVEQVLTKTEEGRNLLASLEKLPIGKKLIS